MHARLESVSSPFLPCLGRSWPSFFAAPATFFIQSRTSGKRSGRDDSGFDRYVRECLFSPPPCGRGPRSPNAAVRGVPPSQPSLAREPTADAALAHPHLSTR